MEQAKRGKLILKEGTVVSNKADKTVTVEVSTRMLHPRYGKVVDRRKKFYAHTDEQIELGKKVKIRKTRPLSKLKQWQVTEVIS